MTRISVAFHEPLSEPKRKCRMAVVGGRRAIMNQSYGACITYIDLNASGVATTSRKSVTRTEFRDNSRRSGVVVSPTIFQALFDKPPPRRDRCVNRFSDGVCRRTVARHRIRIAVEVRRFSFISPSPFPN